MPDQSDLDQLIEPVKSPGTVPVTGWDGKIYSEYSIYEAFAKAQGQFRQPTLNREAKVYSKEPKQLLYIIPYADLQECIDCIKKPLADNGLSFTHTVEQRGNTWLLVLTMRYRTEQSIESIMPINVSQASQQLGSQMTYLKRYQLSAFFGLAADYDDEGNVEAGKPAEFKDKNPSQSSKATSQSKPAAPSTPPKKDAPQAQQGSVKATTKAPEQPKQSPPPTKPPEPEDIPQQAPNYENQDQTKAENKKGPGDFIVEIGAAKHDGKKISQISESDLREMKTWIESQLRKVPPPRNVSKLFDIKTSIDLFFKSVGVK